MYTLYDQLYVTLVIEDWTQWSMTSATAVPAARISMCVSGKSCLCLEQPCGRYYCVWIKCSKPGIRCGQGGVIRCEHTGLRIKCREFLGFRLFGSLVYMFVHEKAYLEYLGFTSTVQAGFLLRRTVHTWSLWEPGFIGSAVAYKSMKKSKKSGSISLLFWSHLFVHRASPLSNPDNGRWIWRRWGNWCSVQGK